MTESLSVVLSPQKAQRHPEVASRSDAAEVFTGLGTRYQVREWAPQGLGYGIGIALIRSSSAAKPSSGEDHRQSQSLHRASGHT